jgi:phage terminase large subunit-like protein
MCIRDRARAMPSAQNNFKTKRLNVWVNADFTWMNMAKWDQCGDSSLSIDDFKGMPVFIAVDLASKIDICSKSYVFDCGDYFAIFTKHYLPQQTIEDSENSQYSGWEEIGRIKSTPGAMIDYKIIEQDLVVDCENFQVMEVALDPWQANYMISNLMADGVNAIELRPTVKHMSSAMKELEGRVISGGIKHDNCPVLTWMISNVVCHADARDNIYPIKQFSQNKIDGAVAVIMAIGRALIHQELTFYEK